MTATDPHERLCKVARAYGNTLGHHLVGIYVHGSVAFGCFHPAISDIDYIAVVDAPLTLDKKRKLMADTVRLDEHAPAKGIEMSVVLRDHCLTFTYPTPYELHYSRAHRAWYHRAPDDYCQNMCGVDRDLAAHFTVIKHRGLALCGAPIDTLFGPVDPAYFLDSIKSDIRHAERDVLSDPVYVILNLCRVAAYLHAGLILSKPEGGRWALQNLPDAHHAVIQSAVTAYESACEPAVDPRAALGFCRSVLAEIF